MSSEAVRSALIESANKQLQDALQEAHKDVEVLLEYGPVEKARIRERMAQRTLLLTEPKKDFAYEMQLELCAQAAHEAVRCLQPHRGLPSWAELLHSTQEHNVALVRRVLLGERLVDDMFGSSTLWRTVVVCSAAELGLTVTYPALEASEYGPAVPERTVDFSDPEQRRRFGMP